MVLTTLRCLANGFIVTSLLWAAALAALMDGRLRQSAAYLLFAGGSAPVRRHPLAAAGVADRLAVAGVRRRCPTARGAMRCQSPYHWAAAYALSAAVLVGLSFFHPRLIVSRNDEAAP